MLNTWYATHPRRAGHGASPAGLASRRCWLQWSGALLVGAATGPLLAHGVVAGDLGIDHPYAGPPATGQAELVVHFRGLRNRGERADRWLSASSPAAERVELRQRAPGADWARAQRLASLPLAPNTALDSRHTGTLGWWLLGLKAPVQVGDRLPLRLRFERAGEVDVVVWVQALR